MEEIKSFINEHKTEIICVACGLIIFRIGFRFGYKSSAKAFNYALKECASALEILHS